MKLPPGSKPEDVVRAAVAKLADACDFDVVPFEEVCEIVEEANAALELLLEQLVEAWS